MLDIHVKLAADEFIRYVRSSATVREFLTTKGQFENDPAIEEMRREYTSMAKEYRQKERSGTLTQDEITKLRSVQKSLNSHPTTVRYARAQQELVTLLQYCNATISENLGFDFAATAAPAASC